MNSSDFIYLFVHLPKSAGTSINKHADKHFSLSQRITISPKLLKVNRDQTEKVIIKFKQYFKKQPKSKKEKLSYITSHHLPYGIHEQINNGKQPYYFTFLRDPSKRVVSLYNYFCQWFSDDKDKDKINNELYQQILLIDGKQPSFINWYNHKYKPNKDNFPNPSNITFYQQLGYLKQGKLTNKSMQECFNKFSFVGLVEHFENDAAFIYHHLGINKFFINQNISKKSFNLKDHPKIAKKLKNDLVNEYKLYNAALLHRQKFIKQHPEYEQIVNQMKKRQQLIRPLTQIIFDWPNNFRLISKNIRQYLPGYGVLLDTIKNK